MRTSHGEKKGGNVNIDPYLHRGRVCDVPHERLVEQIHRWEHY